MKISEDLVYEILSAVSEIPEGKVATYGQIAALIGRERNARLVGKVLSVAGYYGDYPCHRVVNAAGRTAPHFFEQCALLEDEGVDSPKTFQNDFFGRSVILPFAFLKARRSARCGLYRGNRQADGGRKEYQTYKNLLF